MNLSKNKCGGVLGHKNGGYWWFCVLILLSTGLVHLVFFQGLGWRGLEFCPRNWHAWLTNSIKPKQPRFDGGFHYSLQTIQSLPKWTGSMELLSSVYPICLFITCSLASHIIFPVKEGKSSLLFFCLSGKSYLFFPQFLVAGNFSGFKRKMKAERRMMSALVFMPTFYAWSGLAQIKR